MNSLDNAGAVAARDSVAATLDACARRLAAELPRHLPARVVDAAELADIDDALTAAAGQRRPAALGRGAPPRGWLSNYWMSPRDITTATLDRVWAPDTEPH